MKIFFPILILGMIYVLAETKEDVVYYVSPTEPLSSCPGSSSCPPGQLCHTMDYLAEHSSEFFSPDHVNVTLIFMCGVHNYTKDLVVKNFHSFVMKGAAESRENVIIDHQFGMQVGKPNCTAIQFFNISFVNIITLTMRCPAIGLFKESHITVKNCNLYGYPSIKEILSFIYIAERGSQALLDNCTFKENCFVMSCQFSNGIIVNNSTFQSYRHQQQSIIEALSSVVTLTGNVNFTDSSTLGIHSSFQGVFGTAVHLETTHAELESSLNITAGATVYFVNLTSFGGGGAVSGWGATMHISAKARVVFMNNTAYYAAGGAVFMWGGMITVGAESCVIFTYNRARIPKGGGAINLRNATLIVDSEANLTFSHNSGGFGGALSLVNSTALVNTSGIEFYGNRATISGGAIDFIYGTMIINANKSVKFIMNSAQVQGGAIFIEEGIHHAIVVGYYSKLLFINNSAFQGGALYSTMPSILMATVEYQSSIQFINNTAFDVGGAVYSQSSYPCIFMITDYSAKLSFTGNYAQRGVGHHMYGASVRDDSCSQGLISFVNEQGKPHCFGEFDAPDGYINIFSFDPGLNENLSPVSSTPKRVCLCDSNGKPQCANISYIFTNTSVYRGETITVPACIVGYDFGTTVGMIHARSFYSYSLSKRDKLQVVTDSEKCILFNYTVSSNHDYELLLLQTSSLPVISALISNESTEYDIFSYKNNIKKLIFHIVSLVVSTLIS